MSMFPILASLAAAGSNPSADPRDVFFARLTALCGSAFEGRIASPPVEADRDFAGKRLLMHVRDCSEDEIRIPFAVGDDRSRTWVLTRQKSGAILLKHDHRHADGTPDRVTRYGGATSNSGSATRQMFPADEQTTSILPAAAANVWWIELVAGEYFSYNLRRMGTDRYFSIKFDLKKETTAPAAPSATTTATRTPGCRCPSTRTRTSASTTAAAWCWVRTAIRIAMTASINR